MHIYKYKKGLILGLTISFGLCAVLGLKTFLDGNMAGLLLLITSVILAYIFYHLRVSFIITDKYISKTVLGKEEVCNLKLVYAINTEKTKTTGYYCTVIHWSKLNETKLKEYLSTSNKCNENVGKMIITSHVAGYTQLLKEIASSVEDARLDEATLKLIDK